MFLALLALQVLVATPNMDPFAFFQPSVTLSMDDRRQLDRGEPIARVLPSQDHEVAVFAAVGVDIDGDRLVAWMRRIEALKKSAYVLAIGRFSDPPTIEDLAGLALDDEELSEIQACRPGNCGLKLSAVEITQLRRAALAAGSEWKPGVQQAFRHLILQRVRAYLADGNGALPPYENHGGQTWPAMSFASVLGHSVFLTEHLPRFTEYLSRYPQTREPHVESFVYWSKERVAGKAMISATHVSILRNSESSLPDALVAGTQIFVSRYLNASLGIMFRAAAQPPVRALDDALPRERAPISLDARLGELERSLITWALKACDGKASRAAELLQIKRSTLQDRMKRYQFDPDSELRAVPCTTSFGDRMPRTWPSVSTTGSRRIL